MTAGMDMMALQAGLIGMLAFVGFSNRFTSTRLENEVQQEEPTIVENRLERHVANGRIRIDRGELDSHPVSSKQAKKQSGAYQYGIR
jgi:hypothetical protein